MSRLRLTYTSPALRDLLQIAAELEEKAGPRTSSEWIDSFERQILKLQDTPLIGQRDDAVGGRRRLVASPYLIIYELAAEEIRIVRIVHGARDLPRLFSGGGD
jgi:toxin ParE1/3/4